MAISNKPIKLEQAKVISKDYNEKINKKVDAVEGSQLVETTDVEKLKGLANIKKVQVNETDVQVGEDGTLNLDIESVITGDHLVDNDKLTQALADYIKSADAATKTELQSVQELVNKVGKYLGAAQKADLAEKKETANPGDIYTVTDDDNHAYIFCGSEQAGQNGVDENGFLDLGGHFDLSSINTKIESKADQTYVETELGKKANTETVTELQQTVDTKLSESDIVFATDQEVLEQLQAGATAAQGE